MRSTGRLHGRSLLVRSQVAGGRSLRRSQVPKKLTTPHEPLHVIGTPPAPAAHISCAHRCLGAVEGASGRWLSRCQSRCRQRGDGSAHRRDGWSALDIRRVPRARYFSPPSSASAMAACTACSRCVVCAVAARAYLQQKHRRRRLIRRARRRRRATATAMATATPTPTATAMAMALWASWRAASWPPQQIDRPTFEAGRSSRRRSSRSWRIWRGPTGGARPSFR